MMKFSGITMSEEVGQLRANNEILAWKGSHSGHVRSVNLSAIKEAAWSKGQMRLRYFDESSGDDLVLSLAGFEADAYVTLNQHLEAHAFVTIAVHQANAVVEAVEESRLPTLLGSRAPKAHLDDEDIRKIACGEIVEEKVAISISRCAADRARDWACPEKLPVVSQKTVHDDDIRCTTEEPDVADSEPGKFSDAVRADASTSESHPPAVRNPDFDKTKVEPPKPEAARGVLVQRRIASSDDDEGLSCLFDEGFAPKAFDARTHPYFRSSSNAMYGTSLFEGYVWKQSAWIKKWEKRYMVLSTAGLFSYKARNEITPSVVFEGVVSCSASEDKLSRKGFCIVTRDGLLLKRHFIAAENDAARDQWVTKINVALLRNQH